MIAVLASYHTVRSTLEEGKGEGGVKEHAHRQKSFIII
jgi:hypothetical protein